MKTLFHGKFWVILLALIALVGLGLLASGLSSMKFDQPVNGGALENLFNFSELKNGEQITGINWLRYLIPALILIIFLLFMGPIKPQTGSDLIKQIMRFMLFAFVASIFLSRFSQADPFQKVLEPSSVSGGSQTGLQNFTPPTASWSLEFWITTVIIVIVGAFAIFLVNRLADRYFQSKNSLDEIASIARKTLQELSAEDVSDNAIIQCYIRMNAAVNEWRGISRKEDMTPAEFAHQLVEAGMPAEAVGTLTRIFEKVRYGGHGTGPNEIKEAINCLTDILRACEARQ